MGGVVFKNVNHSKKFELDNGKNTHFSALFGEDDMTG